MPRKRSNLPLRPAPTFTFTGSRYGKSLLFYMVDQPLTLTGANVETLVSLCVAALDHDEGYAIATKLDICRLRKKLDTIRPGLGMELIENGQGQEYRLTIPREEIADKVLLTDCFFQLVDREIVTQPQADMLRKSLRVISHALYKEEIKARQMKPK